MECNNLIISNKIKIADFDKLFLNFKNNKQINNKIIITKEKKKLSN